MRIPHHLVLAGSGRLHFRRRVPCDLVEILGRKVIKKSLGTSSLIVAQVRALAVNAQCLSMFAALRDRLMSTKTYKRPKNSAADDLARFDYTLRVELPDGVFRVVG